MADYIRSKIEPAKSKKKSSKGSSEAHTSSNTGECGKCESEISVTADRCPECGYEPGNQGILSKILSLLALGSALIGVIGTLFAVAVSNASYLVGTWFMIILFFVVFTIIPTVYLYGKYIESQLTAVNDES